MMPAAMTTTETDRRLETKGDEAMGLMMVRATVKDERVVEVEAKAEEMFAAISNAEPGGVRYASCKLPDGVTFVVLLEVDDEVENPLLSLPEFNEYQANLKDWIAEPPMVEQLTVVGSYRLFG
jgi:quinol monooxygenase YgiN